MGTAALRLCTSGSLPAGVSRTGNGVYGLGHLAGAVSQTCLSQLPASMSDLHLDQAESSQRVESTNSAGLEWADVQPWSGKASCLRVLQRDEVEKSVAFQATTTQPSRPFPLDLCNPSLRLSGTSERHTKTPLLGVHPRLSRPEAEVRGVKARNRGTAGTSPQSR